MTSNFWAELSVWDKTVTVFDGQNAVEVFRGEDVHQCFAVLSEMAVCHGMWVNVANTEAEKMNVH